jgi:uracil-DNA glycosylase
MGVGSDVFYDDRKIAIAPMGFCYPGTARSGDLAPRPECAPRWREPLLAGLPHLKLTLVIGKYAQPYHLAPNPHANLIETVHAWREF